MINFNLNSVFGKEDYGEVQLGKDSKVDLELLISEIKKYKKKFDEQKIRKAFQMCLQAHNNKLRKSGDPFYTHPLETARILINEIPMDETTIISALLHEVLDSSDFSYNDVKAEFGINVAEVVEGVGKIEHIESHHLNQVHQLENYRKLLLSMLKDVRIILIKLADRLHNMRTLDYLSEDSQIKFALETVEVYAPFANRFGLRNIKWELEDHSFKYLDPENYNEIKKKLNATREQREQYVNELISPIKDTLEKDLFLKKNKIKFEIKGRPKHIFSIYNKMLARGKNMEELYDLHAFRIILDTDDPYICFYVYGIVASIYKPIPETFKDYISAPKKNGYQSIHTGLIGKNNIAVELQIRTVKMNEFAEKGVAAHFKYKDNIDSKSILESNKIDIWIAEIREILDNADESSTEFILENVRKNLLVDEIYVFSPNNEYITLPRESNPLDYAFHIHSDLGYRFIGAKVNGKIVPLDYKLQSGDQVEILTSDNYEPKEEWQNIVTTAKAKNAILKYFKDKKRIIEEKGRKIWQNKIKERGFNLTDDNFQALIKSLKFDAPEDFYFALGTENVDLSKVYMYIKLKIRDGFKVPNNNVKQNMAFNNSSARSLGAHSPRTILANQHNEVYSMEKETEFENKVVRFKIIALDSPSVVMEINNIIMEEDDIDLLSINFESGDKNITGFVKLKISSNVILNNVSKKVRSVHGVHSLETELID
jgi:guanosine-3',5'-bis(diphosphate) 3'-pyrophosphohydrolase